MQEQELQMPCGAILYDAELLRKAALSPAAELFEPAYWRARDGLRIVSGGRASVAFVRASQGEWVLRHYRRGGAMARLVKDRYLWSGAVNTRSFREWRLLAQLHAWHLPVPVPVAARYERTGLLYRADLLTVAIANEGTLAALVQSERMRPTWWSAVGQTIARFHAHGVQHADLNAHNILIDGNGAVYVLDFDRGRIRSRGRWEQAVLARLRRSLVKVSAAKSVFTETEWRELMRGYASFRSP
jgi:3-deoxy-D-manno-octulosonic acid kinase